MDYKLFQNVLDNINDEAVRNFTIACLKDAPEYLETIPASTSGKYHPAKANEKGGLVWHVQRACYFGWLFIQGYQWDGDDLKGDIVLSALLLHDIGKKQSYKNDYFGYLDHPKTAAQMIEKRKDMLPAKVFDLIQGCVKHHMGVYGNKYWKKDIKKYNILELVVHNADLMASRKDIQVNGE